MHSLVAKHFDFQETTPRHHPRGPLRRICPQFTHHDRWSSSRATMRPPRGRPVSSYRVASMRPGSGAQTRRNEATSADQQGGRLASAPAAAAEDRSSHRNVGTSVRNLRRQLVSLFGSSSSSLSQPSQPPPQPQPSTSETPEVPVTPSPCPWASQELLAPPASSRSAL